MATLDRSTSTLIATRMLEFNRRKRFPLTLYRSLVTTADIVIVFFFLSSLLIDYFIILHTYAGLSQAGGPGGPVPPQFLADQLTLSQPGGAHYPHLVLCALPDFQTLRRPCIRHTVVCILVRIKPFSRF